MKIKGRYNKMRKRAHRAKHLLEYWVFGNYVDCLGTAHIAHEDEAGRVLFAPVKKETVSDFIGRTDKAGRAVYEGDIVKYAGELDGEPFEDLFEICWQDDKRWYSFGIIARPLQGKKAETSMFSQEEFSKHITVIGNRWDNPELLEARVCTKE